MSTDVIIDGVSKRYSNAPDSGGVFDINATIPAEKFTTLLGESGSGKTTLLRLLAGFLRPDSGRISMGDDTLADSKLFVPPQARNLAMVFQSYALWPHMSVFDNVAFGLRAQKVRKQDIKDRVESVLSLVELKDFDQRRPAQLSGGQQQRVALARSLVLEPNLLLLDEPLSNLDADLRVQMRNQLKELQMRTGITFVYVTHDQEEAFALSDHMIMLDNGEILQQGSANDIYSRPRSSKVADFMSRSGLHLDGQVKTDGKTFIAGKFSQTMTSSSIYVDDALIAGGNARMLVHSEDLQLCVPNKIPANLVAMPGKVTATTFAGRENHVTVKLDIGNCVTAYSPTTHDYSVDQKVSVAFAPESCWVFPTERFSHTRADSVVKDPDSYGSNVASSTTEGM